MRPLTANEQQQLDRRRENFGPFVFECHPSLIDFATQLKLENPSHIITEPETYVPAFQSLLQNAKVFPADRVWYLTCLGYYIGHVFAQRYAGQWLLNDLPESPYFLRYVVGYFQKLANVDIMFDPFAKADAFLQLPSPRDFQTLLLGIEQELQNP